MVSFISQLLDIFHLLDYFNKLEKPEFSLLVAHRIILDFSAEIQPSYLEKPETKQASNHFYKIKNLQKLTTYILNIMCNQCLL